MLYPYTIIPLEIDHGTLLWVVQEASNHSIFSMDLLNIEFDSRDGTGFSHLPYIVGRSVKVSIRHLMPQ